MHDLATTAGSEGWKSPALPLALCHVNPSPHSACKQTEPATADGVTALGEGDVSTEFILWSAGAQFFSRILVRSSFSRFTIGLGSSFSPAAIMAFS